MNSINSDKPISIQKEDRFQRYDFSKRIAKSILERESTESIVIGVYGAWGEGKTSVINFIENELKDEEKIIIIKFNPWRHNDELKLLEEFFNALAKGLNKSIKSNGNKASDLIKKYGKSIAPISKYLPIVGEVVSGILENVGETISDESIEELKEEVDKIINESKKRIVVFIDDIDRLDKQEIYSIFRLVKLTADFANTAYILSFDETMVASAIGERFGEGNQASGFSFLEKIIQVPLRIPVAQPEALKKYCFELLEMSIKHSGIEFTQDESGRFVNEFTQNILIKLQTPRLAVRYCNSLSFVLPLLKDEVNHIDLMLIEALKIFYPDHYNFVKNNPYFFNGSYSNQMYNSTYQSKQAKITEITNHLSRLGEKLNKNEKKAVRDLLIELFPTLDEAFNNYLHDNSNFNKWYKEKRIVSFYYFNRYFSYSVIEGDVSDIAFSAFIASIEQNEIAQIIEDLKVLMSQTSAGTFLHKLRSYEEDYSWEIAKKLSESISICGEYFPHKDGFFNYEGLREQAAIFIYQLFKNHKSNSEKFKHAKQLLKLAQPFSLAYSINYRFRFKTEERDKIFDTSQYQELAIILIERAINEAGELTIFEKFPENTLYLLTSWAEINKSKLNNYIKTELKNTPKKVLDLLIACTPTMRSTAYPEPYKSDFTKDQFNHLKNLIDVELIREMINSEFKNECESDKVIFSGSMENLQTDINILRQFMYWYNLEIQNIEADSSLI
jgi:predicted KAP-like P-loop ATPase